MDANKLYVFFQDNKITIQNFIHPNKQVFLEYLKSEPLFISAEDIHKKIVSGEVKSNICVNNIENLLNTLNQLNSDQLHSDKIRKNIFQLENKLIKIKEKFPLTFIIGNLYDIEEQYNKIQSNISKLSENYQNDKYKKEISNYIYKITCQINNFFNTFNSFKEIQIKVLEFLRKTIILLQNLLIRPENSTILAKISSFKLFTIFINNYQEPILCFEPTFSERNFIDQTIQFFYDIFKEQIGEEMNNFYNEVKQYMIKDLILFFKDFSWIKESICNQFLTIDYFLSLFSFLSTRIEWIMRELKNQFFSDQTKIDFYLSFLQNVSKEKIPFDVQAILITLNSISKFYIKFVDDSVITQTYTDFLTFYFQENPKNMNPNETLYTNFVNSLIEIQKQRKFYFIDKLFHFLIKNLLNPIFFKKKYQINFATNYPYFLNIKINQSDSFYVDNELKFFYCKNIFYDSIIKRYKNIMTKNYSKFIVHMDMNDMNCARCDIITPYFALGSLRDLYKKQENQRINFSPVDKIVIILEIATALDDLHSHNEYYENLFDVSIFINSNKDAYIGYYYDSHFYSDIKNVLNKLDHEIPVFNHITLESSGLSEKEFIKENQSINIFYFGFLMYEIITENMPFEGIEKYSSIAKKDIGSLLLMGKNYIIDRDIIFKCFANKKERYSSMKEIIESIKQLPIYQQNKDEIEYRLTHAIDAREYQCTISDIIESYYRWNIESYNTINDFIKSCQNRFLSQNCEELNNSNDDI